MGRSGSRTNSNAAGASEFCVEDTCTTRRTMTVSDLRPPLRGTTTSLLRSSDFPGHASTVVFIRLNREPSVELSIPSGVTTRPSRAERICLAVEFVSNSRPASLIAMKPTLSWLSASMPTHCRLLIVLLVVLGAVTIGLTQASLPVRKYGLNHAAQTPVACLY